MRPQPDLMIVRHGAEIAAEMRITTVTSSDTQALQRKATKMMTPTEALARQADRRPGQVAFTAGNDVWTYRRLASETERLARAFLARGVRPGDRVALHTVNRPETALAYHACFRIGAIAAPLNTRFKTAELRSMLQRLNPALYIGEAALYPAVAAIDSAILPHDARFIVGGGVDDGARPWSALLAASADAGPLPTADRDAPAVLLGTSGTTGLSKLVTHTPATLSAIGDACAPLLDLAQEQIAINAVPMMHGSGLLTMLACIRYATPMILFERFDPEAVLDAIAPHRCSWLVGLPFMFVELLRSQRRRPRQVSSLRFCLSSGDVCPTVVQQSFAEVFGVPLRSVWASTEVAGSLIYGQQPGPVSRIAPGAEIIIANDNGAPVARGEVGELLVRGPNVTVGYWAGPGRIDAATTDGWFRTGDLMRQGEMDELWFIGRKKELIIRGGSNISPVEVERVLMAHPAVRDAAVVGVPDPVLGQRVAALVHLAAPPSRALLDDILVVTRADLADYKVPERIKVVDEIPRNTLGKTDRNASLRLLLAANEPCVGELKV
jgi:long-chain acyl-CoA synthetase